MRCLLFACLFLISLSSSALDRFQVEGYVLPNGLQLLLKPGYEKGHVAIRLVVGIGFDDFPCKDKELPHLLEHMLFSGIDDSGEGGLEERMQALGGDWNAFTSNTDTTFVIEAPAQNQRKVLDLLLEVLSKTHFDEPALDTVKRIVEREDGGHYSHLQRWLDRKDLGHSASSQLAVEMGLKCAERPQVDHIQLDQIEDVFKGWYAPNNMTLIVVGDLDRLLPGYLERTYGELDAVDPTEHPPLPEANSHADTERTLIRGGLGDGARLHLIFTEPVLDDQPDETLQLLDDYFEWALYSDLRLKRGLSYGPWVDREVFGGSGLMSLNADVEGDDVEQAKDAMLEVLKHLQADGLDPATFARIKQAAIAKQAWAVQGNSALADYYWGAINDYDKGRFADPGKRYKAVSLDGANRVMRELLGQKGYWRIEQPLLSYNQLYWLVVGAIGLVVLLIGWRISVYRRRR
jgi:predicted Zn-dependent peptidase